MRLRGCFTRRVILILSILLILSLAIPAFAVDELPEATDKVAEEEIEKNAETTTEVEAKADESEETGTEDTAAETPEKAESTSDRNVETTESDDEFTLKEGDMGYEYIYNSEYLTRDEALARTRNKKKMLKAAASSVAGTQKYISYVNCPSSVASDRKWRYGRVFELTGDSSYKGTCCEPGEEALSNGTATLTRLQNTSNEAKAVYYFGYLWSGTIPGDGTSYSGGLASHLGESTLWNGGVMLEGVAQRAHTGSDIFRRGTSASNVRHNAIRDLFAQYPQWQTTSVPADFEIYVGNAGSKQDFVIWKLHGTPESISVKIIKGISNNLVSGNALYSAEGTTFALYNSAADAINNTNAKYTFSITNGQSNSVDVIPGTYYLVETKAGSGLIIPDALKASTGGKAIIIESANTINI